MGFQENIKIKPDEKKPVNIVMLTYNRLEFTKQCLASFKKTVDYPHKLTIVDNNSTDGTRTWLKENGFDFVPMDENVGISKGCNYAWYNGPKDYFLKLDNDIIFKKHGWLSEMVKAVDAATFAGVISYWCFDERRNGFKQPVNIRNINGVQVRDIIQYGSDAQGACLMIPKRTWEKLGYFCEEYNPYGQVDADYGWRCSAAGLRNCYMMDEDCISHLGEDTIEKIKNPEYFQQKESQRDENIAPGGKFWNNVNAYRTGERQLYHDTMWAHQHVIS